MEDFSRRAVMAGGTATLISSVFGRATMADEVIPLPMSKERQASVKRLNEARYWGCQYQNIDVAQVSASRLDLIVVDHALGSPDSGIASAPDVERMKRKPNGGRRIVIAYLSVGEAENYRPYWQAAWNSNPPVWLSKPNANWPGAYLVRYWDRDWQDINYSADGSILDLIVRAGFDGVFLDRVDAYTEWQAERPRSGDDMIALVAGLATRARAMNPGFLVISQNAEGLLRDPRFREHIDGAAKESLLFGLAEQNKRNTDADIAWSLRGLNAVKRAGLPVFAIEYIDDRENIARATKELNALGFLPVFAKRELDELPEIPEFR